MKSKTILYIAVIAISCCIFLSFKTTQTIPKKFVTVRVIEETSVLGLGRSQVIVAYENGKTEEYALKSLSNENFAKNSVTLNDILNDFSDKGYHLDFVTSTGTTGNGLYHSYVFSK